MFSKNTHGHLTEVKVQCAQKIPVSDVIRYSRGIYVQHITESENSEKVP
jgi:hypothetical protein